MTTATWAKVDQDHLLSLLPVSSSTLPSLPYSGPGHPSHSLINSVVPYSYAQKFHVLLPSCFGFFPGHIILVSS